jgi:hypothetical protein
MTQIIITFLFVIFFVLVIGINIVKMLNLYFNSEVLKKLNFVASKSDTKSELTIYYIIVIAVSVWIIIFCINRVIIPLL